MRFRHYVINLAKTTDLLDSGLGWLRKFTRWAGERGIGVQVINARPEHTESFRQWDIPVHTPGDHRVSQRLGNSAPRLAPAPEVPLRELKRVEA